jgi:hypothetical protein
MRRVQGSDKPLIVAHLVFAMICIATLLTPFPRGWQFALLVLLYNIGLPVLASRFQRSDWLSIWIFVLPLSIFQVFPDWWLSAQLKTLVFPEDGFFKIGTVSAYMALLWVIPLFLIIYIAEKVRIHINPAGAFLAAGLAGLIIFGLSEATLWKIGSWHAQDVKMIAHMALYVLPAEFILSTAAYTFYRLSFQSPPLVRIIAAFSVMLMYTGALCFFYFFIEG